MVAGDDHQRPENDFFKSGRLDLLNDRLAGSVLGLALHGSDEDVHISERVHLRLHLAVGDLRRMGSPVSHEDKCRAVLRRCLCAVKSRRFGCGLCDCLCDRLLVRIDCGRVRADFSQKGLRDLHGLEHAAEAVHCLRQFIVLRAVHEVGGLDHQLFDPVCRRALQRLLNVVDLLAIPCIHMVNDDL